MHPIFQKAQKIPLDPVIGLIGGDSILRQRLRQALVKRALGDAMAEMNFSKFQVGETSISEILAACQEYPCLAERRVVVLSDLGKLKKKEAAPWIVYLKSPQVTTCLIVDAAKLDGRLEWVKVFKKSATLVELLDMRKPELFAWVQESFAKEDKEFEEGVVENLIDWVGPHLGALEQAVTQLSLYVGERSQVSREDIEELLQPTSEENIFEVIEALFAETGPLKHQRLDRLLSAGEPPLKILSLIYRHLSILLALASGPAGEAWGLFRMPPGLRHRYETQARRFGKRLHYGLLGPLTRADRKLKGSPLGKEIILKEAMEDLGQLLL